MALKTGDAPEVERSQVPDVSELASRRRQPGRGFGTGKDVSKDRGEVGLRGYCCWCGKNRPWASECAEEAEYPQGFDWIAPYQRGQSSVSRHLCLRCVRPIRCRRVATDDVWTAQTVQGRPSQSDGISSIRPEPFMLCRAGLRRSARPNRRRRRIPVDIHEVDMG